jgi:hypothetical protein
MNEKNVSVNSLRLELQEKANAMDVGTGRGSSQGNRAGSPYRNSNQVQQSLRHIADEGQGNMGWGAISTSIMVRRKRMQSIREGVWVSFWWDISMCT